MARLGRLSAPPFRCVACGKLARRRRGRETTLEDVASEYRDRILDWHDELRRLAPELPSLPQAAREALDATVARFLWEDARALPAPQRSEEAA